MQTTTDAPLPAELVRESKTTVAEKIPASKGPQSSSLSVSPDSSKTSLQKTTSMADQSEQPQSDQNETHGRNGSAAAEPAHSSPAPKRKIAEDEPAVDETTSQNARKQQP